MRFSSVNLTKPLALLVLASSLSGNCLAAQEPDKAAEFKFGDVDYRVLEDSRAVDQQYQKKGLVMHDPQLQAYVDSVGQKVLGKRPVPEQVEFKFFVLRDPMVQAFALPNGSVYVTTGLLSLMENEAQLAGVLGHETAHVFNRHGYLENRSVRKKALTINILQIAAAAAPTGPNLAQSAQIFGAAVQLGAAIGSTVLVASIFGYSREMEHQADNDGLTAMTSASYDPTAMARAFELLDSDSKLEFEPIQGFYHDHPKLTDRREFAMQYAASHKVEDAVAVSEKDYLDKVSGAVCYEIQADLESRRPRTAVDRAARLTRIFPDNPKYQVLLADAYRGLGAETREPTEEERNRHGKVEHRKEYFSMTEQEAQKKLMQTPEGQATLHDNQAQAEKLYQGVMQSNPAYAEAHRGLGFLYEAQNKVAQAAAEYRRYLEATAGTSLDHLRIERRAAALEKLAGVPAQP